MRAELGLGKRKRFDILRCGWTTAQDADIAIGAFENVLRRICSPEVQRGIVADVESRILQCPPLPQFAQKLLDYVTKMH